MAGSGRHPGAPALPPGQRHRSGEARLAGLSLRHAHPLGHNRRCEIHITEACTSPIPRSWLPLVLWKCIWSTQWIIKTLARAFALPTTTTPPPSSPLTRPRAVVRPHLFSLLLLCHGATSCTCFLFLRINDK
ncbi:uncharacterized protein BJ171DRAFT_459472 [Polychytrium aggregatum]|uniref:uncharacterized protein n=1 Tax=Polychytrium aggregatum TaxID=110093 RepID=UPI0022FF3449|nr:uncharacterized protein BJ171DRAFT_459472 [Polychytrium aggregatum]KAI9204506.1 hypothetical protein BJ171DRAFT_459472 [Polychytrium aggregatum]